MTWLYLGQIKSDFHKIFMIPFLTLNKLFFDQKKIFDLKKTKKKKTFLTPPKKKFFDLKKNKNKKI